MEPGSAGYGVGWLVGYIGDVLFRYVPATVSVLTGNAPELGIQNPIVTPITQPVTTAQLVDYLSATAQPGYMAELYRWWGTLTVLSVLFSLFLTAGTIYSIIRILQIRRHEEERFAAAAHPVAAHDIPKAQLRWNRIREQISTDNEQGWRLAILEADIMLNELLDLLAYRGETMADKMKQVERADWKTIDLAWEAHKVRNAIAHQGSMQRLDAREARRVIGLYEQVFKEFKFVE
jgi:hypothetical protein